MTKAEVNDYSAVKSIKTFMEMGGDRKVEMKELKELTPEERTELGELSKQALLEIAD